MLLLKIGQNAHTTLLHSADDMRWWYKEEESDDNEVILFESKTWLGEGNPYIYKYLQQDKT